MLRLKLLNSLTLAYVNSSLIKMWTTRQDTVPCVEMSVGAGNSLTLAYVNSSLIKMSTTRQDTVPCVEMSVGAGNSLTRKHDDHTS